MSYFNLSEYMIMVVILAYCGLDAKEIYICLFLEPNFYKILTKTLPLKCMFCFIREINESNPQISFKGLTKLLLFQKCQICL